MSPDLFPGSWHLNTYWLVTYLSFIPVAAYSYYAGVYLENVSRKIVLGFIGLLFIVQLLGGKLVPFFFQWFATGILPSLSEFLSMGRFYHSVFFSALLFYIFFILALKRPIARFLDYFSIGACMMSVIGRVGCFLEGCCAGKPTHCLFAMKFPNLPEPVHPTQLYHFFFEGFVILPLLFVVQKKKRFEGETFCVYLFSYAVFRFFVEFFRVNMLAFFGLTHAQLFSAFLILLSGFFLVRGAARR